MGNVFNMQSSTGTAFEGSCVVFATPDNKHVIKLPADDAKDAFMRELHAIKCIHVPQQCEFVHAEIVSVTLAMLEQVPRHLKHRVWKGCVEGTPAILMDMLSGCTALEKHLRRTLDPDSTAEQLAGLLISLQKHGICNTDVKLENMQILNDGTLVFLDWGSLCRTDKSLGDIPTYTYAVAGYQLDPKVAMSINITCTLIEMHQRMVPITGKFTPIQYAELRQKALSLLQPETRKAFETLLVPAEAVGVCPNIDRAIQN